VAQQNLEGRVFGKDRTLDLSPQRTCEKARKPSLGEEKSGGGFDKKTQSENSSLSSMKRVFPPKGTSETSPPLKRKRLTFRKGPTQTEGNSRGPFSFPEERILEDTRKFFPSKGFTNRFLPPGRVFLLHADFLGTPSLRRTLPLSYPFKVLYPSNG